VGIFERVRRDSAGEADERSELVAALAFVAGVAAGLAAGGEELRELDALDSLVWIFFTGVALGFGVYWIAGWALAFVVRRLGGAGSSRLTRHVLAFSFAPLALAVVVWLVWAPLLVGLAIASLALLVLGLREVHGWSALRAGAAVGLAAVWLGALSVALASVLVLLGRVGE
jgi:hypothetical protein